MKLLIPMTIDGLLRLNDRELVTQLFMLCVGLNSAMPRATEEELRVDLLGLLIELDLGTRRFVESVPLDGQAMWEVTATGKLVTEADIDEARLKMVGRIWDAAKAVASSVYRRSKQSDN